MTDSPYQFKTDRYSSHSVILSCLGEGRGRRLLDVGAAQGYLAERLTARGYEVTCLEGDPSLASVAATKCSTLIVADLDKAVPELDGPFDVILYGDVLEHLKDPLRILKLLNQYLKPAGIVVISVPNVAHLWVRLHLLSGKFEHTNRGILDESHLRFFTLASFRRFVQKANLEITKLIPTPVPLPLVIPDRYHGRVLDLMQTLNVALARSWKSLLAYQFVAVANRREAP